MNRRKARIAALAAFVVSFLAPWGDTESFPDFVWRILTGHGDWAQSTIVGVILSVVTACVAAIIWPSAWMLGIVYRTILVVFGFPLLLVIALLSMAFYPPIIVEAWGVPLYGAALVLAFAIEVYPVRRRAERDYSEVFR